VLVALAAAQEEAVDQPTLVLDTADLDTAALLDSESADEVSEAPAEQPAVTEHSVVEAPAASEAPIFEAPQEAMVEAPRKLVGDAGQNSAAVIEALLAGIDDAKSIGASSLAAEAESRAQALARDALTKAMDGAKTIETAWSLNQAFDHARRAGITESERDSAWVRLRSEIHELCQSAMKAAKKTATTATMRGLADALFIWRKLAFCHKHHMITEDALMLDNAREIYATQLQASFVKEDFSVTALAVQLADEAGAKYDRRAKEWVEVKRKLHDVASNLGQHSLAGLLNIVEPAKEFPLPRTQELLAVEALAQNLTKLELKTNLASNHTPLNHIDVLLAALEDARRAGVDRNADVQTAEETARSIAANQLKKAIAGTKDLQSVATIKDSFTAALRTGVPDVERDTAWATLESELHAKLISAGKAANATPTIQTIQDLANAAFLWRKFDFPNKEIVLGRAIEVYERQLDAAFHKNDLNFTMVAVRLADQAGARCNPSARRWAEVHHKLVGAVANLEQQTVQGLLTVLQQAKDVALPHTSDVNLAEAKALSLAMAQLQAAGNASSLEPILIALENARAASANKEALKSTQMKVESLALAELKQVLAGTKSVGSMPLIKEAFALAERAGVLETERTSAWTGLQKEMQSRAIDAAVAANATRSAQTIEELADSLFLWKKLKFSDDGSRVLARGQEVYGQLIEAGLKAQDSAYIIVAVRFAGQAGVKCSESATTWADIAGKVQLTAANIGGQTPSALVTLVKAAKDIGYPLTSEFRLLESAARTAVAQELKRATST